MRAIGGIETGRGGVIGAGGAGRGALAGSDGSLNESELPPARRRLWPCALLGLLALILIALAIAWSQREPIARDFIDRELARRGVDGSYDLVEIGFARQRVENLVIGDPADPDLTARSAVIETRIGVGLPEVRRIVVNGVRLKGRLVEGRLDLGQVSRLMPAPSGEPFRLPEIALALSDSLLLLETPYGPIAIGVEGEGWLPDGFGGTIAAAGNRLTFAGCGARRVRLTARVHIDDRRPSFDGLLHGDALACRGRELRIARPSLELDATLSEGFDRWEGQAEFALDAVSQASNRALSLRGTVSFAGSAERTAGNLVLDGLAPRIAGASARRIALHGDYEVGERGAGFAGEARLAGARIERAAYASLAGALTGADGTPLDPLGEALARAIDRAAARFDATLSFAAFARGGVVAARVPRLAARSRSGAAIRLAGGEGLRLRWPGPRVSVDGAFRLAGGGFPETRFALARAGEGAPLSGTVVIAPFSAGGSRLALAPIRFAAAPGGATRIATSVDLSGPLAGGRIERLRVPVSGVLGRGGALAFGQLCVPLSWSRLTLASLVVVPTEVPLCPLEGGAILRRAPGGSLTGGAQIARPRLRATIGGSPLLATADRLRIPFARPGFTADDVALRLGPSTRLDLATLAGDFARGGIAGRYAGADGQIAAVPLRMSEGAGRWSLLGGSFAAEGGGRLTHLAERPLFEPLVSDDLRLRFAGNLITATATLAEPGTETAIVDVDLTHDFNAGAGEARLDTPRLLFGERLQPDALTYVTTGVIAEVNGLLSGTGHIRWGPAGVTSDGVYRIADANMAAPFGPVEGLDTEIVFTDLLALRSAPGQTATVQRANPGVLVEDGALTYQILSSGAVRVEAGRWPFAGGALILEPTVLEFGPGKVQRLTFRVEGLDAFAFLEERQFENLAATGILDGVLPVVVDQGGARIEGGYLVSRPEGGSLSYTGEISDVNLGVFGTLAFNALELIRYSTLTIRFDGAIDGEMVTNVDFTGVTPNIAREGQSFLVAGLTGPLSRLPVRFDITMRAPFQGLLYSVRLLDDPTFLVSEAIARHRAQSLTQAERDVQALESEPMP